MEPVEDIVESGPRFACGRERWPPFLFEAIGEPEDLTRVSLLAEMGPTSKHALRQIDNAIEFFQLVAGAKIETFMPEDWIGHITIRDTRHVYEGRVYTTGPFPSTPGTSVILFAVESGVGL